jgi:hypothetical protein
MARFSEQTNETELLLEQQAMENIVSLSSSEERERKLFMQDLSKFMVEIGKPLSKIPIMGYKELDLFQLFKEVAAYGGFNEVVKNVGTWSKIWKRLANFDPSITDSSFRLKKNYERYLLEYEYKVLPEHRQQAIDMEKRTQIKKPEPSAGAETASATTSPILKPKSDKNKKKTKRKLRQPSMRPLPLRRLLERLMVLHDSHSFWANSPSNHWVKSFLDLHSLPRNTFGPLGFRARDTFTA